MGISPDSLVLIQDNLNHDILFLTSTRAVIGWTALQNSIRIYFHQVSVIFLNKEFKETMRLQFYTFPVQKIFVLEKCKIVV